MSAEPTRSGQLQKRQLAELRRYLVDEVHPYVPVHRRALDAAGIDRGRIAGLDEFARLPLVSIADVGTGAGHLMEPTPDLVRSSGPLALRLRANWSLVTGRSRQLDLEVLGPRYKPLVWTRDGDLRTGWSAHDLRRLGELGRRLLERAGVRGDDRMLTLGLEPEHVGFWQLSLGARAGGVSAFHQHARGSLPDDASVTVVAGTPAALTAAFTGVPLSSVRTLIAIGPPLTAAERADLAVRSGAEVVQAWAPPGVRAMWSERLGAPGLVTAADSEVVEVVDGEVVWSSLGWAGTVLLRLRTGVRAALQAADSGTGGVAITLLDPVLEAA